MWKKQRSHSLGPILAVRDLSLPLPVLEEEKLNSNCSSHPEANVIHGYCAPLSQLTYHKQATRHITVQLSDLPFSDQWCVAPTHHHFSGFQKS